VQSPYRRANGPLNLLVDSTGIKFLGDGEWQARKHGVQSRRQWRKVHLAMDTATSDIRAVEFTPSSDGDSPVLPDLLDQIPDDEDIGTVTADGTYDTRRCHAAIIARGGTAIIPIRKNGRPWKEDAPLPDETTHCRFRNALVAGGVYDDLLAEVCHQIEGHVTCPLFDRGIAFGTEGLTICACA
jgi:hypothetical protein